MYIYYVGTLVCILGFSQIRENHGSRQEFL